MVAFWDDPLDDGGTLDASMRPDRIGSGAVGRWLDGDELEDDMFRDLVSMKGAKYEKEVYCHMGFLTRL
jgi:hypothetical protein